MHKTRRATYLKTMGVPDWMLPIGVDAEQPELVSPERTGAAQNKPLQQTESTVRVIRAPTDWSSLERIVASCTACDLHEHRKQAVVGTGDRSASLMIVGEAPGAEEDQRGEPFVGQAGQLLDAMLRAIGFDRSQVYIANVLKCRPPSNRNPRVEETQACSRFLELQMKWIQPDLVVVLGGVAAHHLLESDMPVGKLRGEHSSNRYGAYKTIVTYHPAYLLRNPAEKAKVWKDLQQVAAALR